MSSGSRSDSSASGSASSSSSAGSSSSTGSSSGSGRRQRVVEREVRVAAGRPRGRARRVLPSRAPPSGSASSGSSSGSAQQRRLILVLGVVEFFPVELFPVGPCEPEFVGLAGRVYGLVLLPGDRAGRPLRQLRCEKNAYACGSSSSASSSSEPRIVTSCYAQLNLLHFDCSRNFTEPDIACLSGVVVALKFDSISATWMGSTAVSCPLGDTAHFTLQCDSDSWQLPTPLPLRCIYLTTGYKRIMLTIKIDFQYG